MYWQLGSFFVLVIAVASPALTQNPAAPAEAARAAKDNEVICKRQKATGSRFEKKTCRTVRQWESIREQQMRDAKEFIDRPTIETNRGG